MAEKLPYEELEQKVKELENEVAQHRQSVKDLLVNERDRYHKLIQDSNEAIVIAQGIEVKFANKEALRMWGYQDDEEMPVPLMTDMISPKDRAIMVQRGGSRERGEDVPSRYEFSALRKDGTEFLAELSVSRIIYQGKVARQAVIRDITERKQAEEALKQSEERYRLLAENVTDIIWTMDMNLNLTYYSPSVTRLQGFTVEEALARTIEESMTPASYDVVMKTLTEELELHKKGQKPLDRSRKLEVELFCKDGSTIWAEVEANFIHNADGQLEGVIGITRDITDRRKVDETLIKSEKKYRLLAENANDVIWTADLNLQATYMSPSIKRIRGYTPEEALNQTLEEVLTPDSFEYATKMFNREIERLRKGIKVDDPYTVEVESYHKDGYTIWMENKISPLKDNEGETIGIFGISRDITKRRQTEQRLLRSEKLASLGNMVAGVAHEISTPLSVSLMSASYLYDKSLKFIQMNQSEEAEAPEVTKYAKKAMEASSMVLSNLKRAIDHLNSFKHVAVDQIVEERRKFDFKKNIENILNSLRPKYKQTAHTITVECPDNLKIYSYPGAFSQIITNLVINSLTHGFMGIEKGKILLTVDKKEDMLLFKYRDTGKGMDKATLKKLFDPFFTTSRSKGGTGLGMHIVHNLVYQTLEGMIECKSSSGRGTEFVIEIPLRDTVEQ